MRLFSAFRFLSVLPFPAGKHEDFGKSVRAAAYFPFVGLVLGAILFGVFFGLSSVFSTFAASIVVLISWVVLTGGLHLDGLADTFDGLLSGKDREKKLLIMKDSRIGVFGALGLVCILLLKLAFLYEVGRHGTYASLMAILPIARLIQVLSIYAYPSARNEGLGRFYKEHLKPSDIFFACASAVVIAVFFLGLLGLVLLAAGILFMICFGISMTRVLGGHTGDTYGATCELAETLLLILISCGVPAWFSPFHILTGL